jgi:pimeloyl-ACP methyl ester carboxylesterase
MQSHHVRGWPIFAEPPAIENISKIKLPLLIIDGDKDIPYIGKACSFIQQNVAGSKRITIPGTGHMLNMEAPEAFNKTVLDFLKN